MVGRSVREHESRELDRTRLGRFASRGNLKPYFDGRFRPDRFAAIATPPVLRRAGLIEFDGRDPGHIDSSSTIRAGGLRKI